MICQVSKCEFGKSELEFLGHKIGHGRLSLPGDRITALKDYKKQVSRKQLRAFLGYVNFYRKLVPPKIHKMTSKLSPATSKESPAVVWWSQTMEEAFNKLCKCLCQNMSLCMPTCHDHFVLETDASLTGMGTVLQVERDGQLLPAAFYSSQLKGAEVNYPTQELEGLALVRAVYHFSLFLYGREFEVRTDHKDLESMMSKPRKNKRVMRWTLSLMDYPFTIKYQEESNSTVAD